MVNGDRPFLILVNGDWKNKIVVIGDCEHFGDSDFAKNSSVISDGEFFSTVNGDFFIYGDAWFLYFSKVIGEFVIYSLSIKFNV